jgi:hypothetical protein
LYTMARLCEISTEKKLYNAVFKVILSKLWCITSFTTIAKCNYIALKILVKDVVRSSVWLVWCGFGQDSSSLLLHFNCIERI